jgi:DNA-binding NarL/FixJ family response regulator
MSVGIVIGTDHQLLREGLISLLQAGSNLRMLGAADNGRQVLELVTERHPDLVLLSAQLPGLNALDVTQRLAAGKASAVRVLLQLIEPDHRFIMRGLKAGVSGFLVKESDFEELLQAVRTVMAGQIYLSPCITGIVVDQYLQVGEEADESAYSVLTVREREVLVLQLIAEGQTTKAVAARLGVSVKTIEWHRQQLMRKLGLDNVASLTKYAIREGLTSVAE